MEAIITAFTQGGIWMWAILGVQIISVAIILERIIALYMVRSANQAALASQFEREIKSGNLEGVLRGASTTKGSIGVVIQAGAQAALDMGGKEEIQDKMDEVLINENQVLDKRTGFLSMLGNVGTLLGLLGTIVGLIKAFSSIGGEEGAAKAAMLSEGVSMAMNTTAYGLIMAIPTLIMYAILQNRTNALSEDLNKGALRIYNWLSYSYDSVGNKQAK